MTTPPRRRWFQFGRKSASDVRSNRSKLWWLRLAAWVVGLVFVFRSYDLILWETAEPGPQKPATTFLEYPVVFLYFGCGVLTFAFVLGLFEPFLPELGRLPWRRWSQFSLGTLILLMVIAALVATIWNDRTASGRREAALREEIARLEAQLAERSWTVHSIAEHANHLQRIVNERASGANANDGSNSQGH